MQHNLRIFLYILELMSRKLKFKFRENCFWKWGLRNSRGVLVLSPESTKYCWRFDGFFWVVKVVLWTNISLFHKSEITLSKQLFLNFFFCLNALRCLKTCVSCVTNCVTSKIYPLEVWMLEMIFKESALGRLFYRVAMSVCVFVPFHVLDWGLFCPHFPKSDVLNF